jgi:hypothetical protein
MAAAAAAIRVRDARLPLEKLSLHKFTQKALKLREEAEEANDDEGKLAKWMEYGIAGIQAGESRASIDMKDNEVNSEWRLFNDESIKYRHDFDSLMGRCDTIPYTIPVEIFPVFMSGFRIRNGLHIPPMTFSTGVSTLSFPSNPLILIIL